MLCRLGCTQLNFYLYGDLFNKRKRYHYLCEDCEEWEKTIPYTSPKLQIDGRSGGDGAPGINGSESSKERSNPRNWTSISDVGVMGVVGS